MKRFLQGLATGGLVVGTVWVGLHLWSRSGLKEWEMLQLVVKETLETRLPGAEFLEMTGYREVPPSEWGLLVRSRQIEQFKQFDANVIYKKNNQFKRMLMPIWVEDGKWSAPHADSLAQRDSDAMVTVDLSGSN